jgi:hemerythrin-like domain-containing protein
MREVHRRLREALVLTREAIEDEADVDPLRSTPLLHCWGSCAALSSHHAGEDRSLFPRLVERHPDLAEVVRRLGQDHSMIEHLIGGLRRALDDGASTAEKLRQLDGVEAVMESHFRFEERRLLDLLDRIDDDHPGPRELYGALAE